MYLVYYLKINPCGEATLERVREIFTTVTETEQPTWATHQAMVEQGDDPGMPLRIDQALNEMIGVERYHKLAEGEIVAC